MTEKERDHQSRQKGAREPARERIAANRQREIEKEVAERASPTTRREICACIGSSVERVNVAINVLTDMNALKMMMKINVTATCTRTLRRVPSLRVPRGKEKAQAFVSRGNRPVRANMVMHASSSMTTCRPRLPRRRVVVVHGRVVVPLTRRRARIPPRLRPAPLRAPHLLPLDGHSNGC